MISLVEARAVAVYQHLLEALGEELIAVLQADCELREQLMRGEFAAEIVESVTELPEEDEEEEDDEEVPAHPEEVGLSASERILGRLRSKPALLNSLQTEGGRRLLECRGSEDRWNETVGLLDLPATLPNRLAYNVRRAANIPDHLPILVRHLSKVRTFRENYISVSETFLSHLRYLTNLQSVMLSESLVTDGGLKYLSELPYLKRLRFSDSQLKNISRDSFSSLSSIQTINFRGCTLSETALEGLKHCPKLSEISFKNCSLPEAAWDILSDVQPLRTLRVTSDELDDQMAADIAKLTQISSLYLISEGHPCVNIGLGKLSDKGLSALAPLTNLKSFLVFADLVTGSGFVDLRSLVNLEDLSIASRDFEPERCVELIHFSNLKSISIAGRSLDERCFAGISSVTPLESLTLENFRSDVSSLSLLAKLPYLTSLEFRASAFSAPEGELARLPAGLKQLEFDESCNGVDHIASAIIGCPELESLEISSRKFCGSSLPALNSLHKLQKISFSSSGLDDDSILKLRNLESLKDLDLSETLITDRAFETIGALYGLEELYARDLGSVDDGIGFLSRLTHLHKLWLGGSQLTSRGMELLGHLKGLKRLDLERTGFTDAGLQGLVGLENLESLGLELTLISDDGLCCLPQFKRLDYLGLGSTLVSDKGIDILAKLTNLTSLSVVGTNITEEGARRLRDALPNCVVYS